MRTIDEIFDEIEALALREPTRTLLLPKLKQMRAEVLSQTVEPIAALEQRLAADPGQFRVGTTVPHPAGEYPRTCVALHAAANTLERAGYPRLRYSVELLLLNIQKLRLRWLALPPVTSFDNDASGVELAAFFSVARDLVADSQAQTCPIHPGSGEVVHTFVVGREACLCGEVIQRGSTTITRTQADGAHG